MRNACVHNTDLPFRNQIKSERKGDKIMHVNMQYQLVLKINTHEVPDTKYLLFLCCQSLSRKMLE
jgi:hypothetical protein